MARPGRWASKPWAIAAPAEIIDVLPWAKYRLQWKIEWSDTGAELVGYRAGRMKKNGIVLMIGDWVKIEISEYDFSKWRIVYRYRNEQDAMRDFSESAWSEEERSPRPNQWPKRPKNSRRKWPRRR